MLIFQFSFVDTPGILCKKGQNAKLPFLTQKLSHYLLYKASVKSKSKPKLYSLKKKNF